MFTLLTRGITFLIGHFFQYKTYYPYEIDVLKALKQNTHADLIPDIPNLILKTVSTNEQSEELDKEDWEVRSQFINSRKRLDRGAIAFCIFIEREIANIGWVTLNQQAKDSLNELPFKVGFSNQEACTGGAVTNPKYRNMGLMRYSYFKRLEFLEERGKTKDRAAVAKSNIAAQTGMAKICNNIYAEARFLKIMWCKSWKERPVTRARVHNEV
jgi:hypothetical protein